LRWSRRENRRAPNGFLAISGALVATERKFSGLDEKLVGMTCERGDPLDVGRMVGRVDAVCDPLAGSQAQRLGLEPAERNRSIRRDENLGVVVASAPYRALGLVESRPDRKQPVESREMIHMGMGHENVADPENFTGRKRVDVAEIEQDCRRPKRKSIRSPGSEKTSLMSLGWTSHFTGVASVGA
jgi:hypothetical protein